MVEKHTRDPQIILEFLKIIWGLFSKQEKKFSKENYQKFVRTCLLNTS